MKYKNPMNIEYSFEHWLSCYRVLAHAYVVDVADLSIILLDVICDSNESIILSGRTSFEIHFTS